MNKIRFFQRFSRDFGLSLALVLLAISVSWASDNENSEFNTSSTAFHHISDQNIYSIGPLSIPLPCFLYSPESGFSSFMSSKFDIGHHGTGHKAVDGYVLYEGMVRRVEGKGFPEGIIELNGDHPYRAEMVMEGGKKREKVYVEYKDQAFLTLAKSTLDGGMLGGGITNFYDFSLTKNVVTMILVGLFLLWLFIGIAKSYSTRQGMAPSGLQSLIEPVFEFIQEEVSKPFLGSRYEKFQPFLMTLFFFILALNLFGQIPFLGGSNVTGNLSFTLVLAVLAFIITNINGNKHYWKHVLWMPGVPPVLRALILTPVEILGLFIKPLTLMLRLAANITAGHMIIIIFVSLIFIFGQAGESLVGSGIGAIVSIPLTMFMMAIELLVAFIQAFVFTILTASYIGAATEDAHHH